MQQATEDLARMLVEGMEAHTPAESGTFAEGVMSGPAVHTSPRRVACNVARQLHRYAQHSHQQHPSACATDVLTTPSLRFDINPDLTADERKLVENVLQRMKHAFATPATPPQPSPNIEHVIHLTDPHPVKQAPYRQSPQKREAVHKEVQRLLEMGLIVPSASPWSSPVSLVPKPDGSYRMVIDYRRVNAQTRKDAYPVPLIEDCLNACKDAKWVSIIDIKDAYHHIPMALESRGVTAFVTADGLFEWNRMPFGLANAPATFQRYVDHCLRDFIGQFCAVFFDDCLVYTNGTLEEHLKDVTRLLERLHSVSLEASASKCRFAYKEVLFVGHVVGNGTIKPDPDKLTAIHDYPAPTTVTELKAFLGLANYYRRFVRGFAAVAKPLYELLKKGVVYEWSQNRQLAFAALKHALVSAPCLHAPDFALPFILQTDASELGISAVLSQMVGGEEHPVGFVSRQLNKAEKNYSPTEWECLAVVWGVAQFEPLLIDSPFTIVTDHSALQWLATKRMDNKRLTRWALALQEFAYTIRHRAGKMNANADALSRAPRPNSAPSEDEMEGDVVADIGRAHFVRRIDLQDDSCAVLARGIKVPHAPAVSEPNTEMADVFDLTTFNEKELDEVARAQASDPQLRDLYRFVERSEVPAALNPSQREKLVRESRHFAIIPTDTDAKVLYFHPGGELSGLRAVAATPPRLVVPTSYRAALLNLYHSSPFGGHSGIKRTLRKIASRYFWDTLYPDVVDYVTHCETCQKARVQRHTPPQRTGRIPASAGAWEVISMDYAGPFPECEGFTHILLVVDHFTNYVVAIPTSNTSAGTTARALVDEVICRFGMPAHILTDRGSSFHNALLSDLGELLHIKTHLTSGHHPQANGKAERTVGLLKTTLTSIMDEYSNNWIGALQPAVFALNSSPSSRTTFSPFYLNFGRHPRLPGEELRSLTYEHHADANPREAYAIELAANLHDAHQFVKTLHRADAQQISQQNAELRRTPVFKVGDLVLMKDPRADAGMGLPALAKPYMGPFMVMERIAEGSSYIIRTLRDGRLSGVQMTVHASRLRPYPVNAGATTPPVTSQVSPQDMEVDQAPAPPPHQIPAPTPAVAATSTSARAPVTATVQPASPAEAAILRHASQPRPLYQDDALRPSGPTAAARYSAPPARRAARPIFYRSDAARPTSATFEQTFGPPLTITLHKKVRQVSYRHTVLQQESPLP